MTRFFVRRIASSLVVFFLSSALVFAIARVIPGDPLTIMLGGSPGGADPRAIAALRAEYGLDKSLPAQYLSWLGGFLHGDMGTSYVNSLPVSHLIGARIVPTVELATLSLLLGAIIAVCLAILAAMRPTSWFGRNTSSLATIGVAVPEYWLGVILITIFSVKLGWLPSRGYVAFSSDPLGNLRLIALPCVTLALIIAAPILRFLRSSFSDVLSARYVRTARGKGLSRLAVVTRHALPNSLIPAVTIVGVIYGQLVGGVVTLEYVFGWPGLGSLAVNSILQRDYITLQGVALLAVVGFVASSLAVDLMYLVLNPRVRTRT